MGCKSCLAKGATCGTGSCDGHVHDSTDAVLDVIRNNASYVAPMSRSPFATVRGSPRKVIPAFGRGAGAVGGTGTGQFDYAGNADDPTKSTTSTTTTSTGPDYNSIAAAIAATGSAIGNVVNAAKGTTETTGQTAQSLTTTLPPTPASTTPAPLGVPLPYWIGAGALIAGVTWWAKAGKRRRR